MLAIVRRLVPLMLDLRGSLNHDTLAREGLATVRGLCLYHWVFSFKAPLLSLIWAAVNLGRRLIRLDLRAVLEGEWELTHVSDA